MTIYHGAINKDIQIVTNEKINCLVTYAAYKKFDWQPWWKKLFIDSGAFSVHNSGKTIDVAQYADYLLQWQDSKKPIVYASLDVIGNAKAGFKNYKYLVKRGLNPIPTYHYGESFDILKQYAEYTNYIALGATVGLSTGARRLFFDSVFSAYPDPKKLGFHGFGITAPPLIKSYPWATIDSTMAMRWAMYGQLYTPWGRYTAMNSIDRKHHITEKLGAKSIEIMKTWMASFGVNWDEVIANDKKGQMSKQYVNIRALEETKLKCPTLFSNKRVQPFSLLDF